LFSQGEPLGGRTDRVEDYAAAQLNLDSGAVVQLSCSWKLHAGRDCVIEASFYGTRGGATFRNINGSFYDFTAELMRGTARETLCAPPDEWSSRAAIEWARRLVMGDPVFDPAVDRLINLAEVLDRLYGRD